ncbi:MAG: hypothetical protein RIS54_2094 [Verrucomicrobiota bacterium]|jgi:hypothetical protein
MAASMPEEILRRIIRLSGINGWCVALVAGLGGLVSLAFADWIGAATGLAVCAGGGLELRGRKQVLQGEATGMRRMVLAQLVVLATLWVYSVVQLIVFDAARLVAELPPEIHAMIADAQLDVAQVQQLLTIANFALYGAVMLASLVYQGGLALYYRHRTPSVVAVLAAPPPLSRA